MQFIFYWLSFPSYDPWPLSQTSNRDKPSDTLQLMGGKVDDLGNRILGIDDGVGRSKVKRLFLKTVLSF